jgi:hypothetical protein
MAVIKSESDMYLEPKFMGAMTFRLSYYPCSIVDLTEFRSVPESADSISGTLVLQSCILPITPVHSFAYVCHVFIHVAFHSLRPLVQLQGL